MEKKNERNMLEAIRWIAGLCAVLTVVWLGLLTALLTRAAPVATPEQAVVFIRNAGILYYLNYLTAVGITLTAVALLAGLGNYYREKMPVLTAVASGFVPIYGLLNLLVYLSQITVVPRFAARVAPVVGQPLDIYGMVLVQLIQGWAPSAMALANGLAYALLAIPSICFGWSLVHSRLSPVAGWLLILNGIACILGFGGQIAQYPILSLGSMVGGGLFLGALIALVFQIRPQLWKH